MKKKVYNEEDIASDIRGMLYYIHILDPDEVRSGYF